MLTGLCFGQFSLGTPFAVVFGWQLGLESSEGSNGLDTQDSFFTYMSGMWAGLGWLERLEVGYQSLHVTSPIWLAWASSWHGGLRIVGRLIWRLAFSSEQEGGNCPFVKD